MPFGVITGSVAGVTYEPRVLGEYHRANLSFADPREMLRISGATVRKDGTRYASIVKLLEKEATIAGTVTRVPLEVGWWVKAPNSNLFTPTEIDNGVADVNLFLTAATISRLMMGES